MRLQKTRNGLVQLADKDVASIVGGSVELQSIRASEKLMEDLLQTVKTSISGGSLEVCKREDC